jgi:hypothetical protein
MTTPRSASKTLPPMPTERPTMRPVLSSDDELIVLLVAAAAVAVVMGVQPESPLPAAARFETRVAGLDAILFAAVRALAASAGVAVAEYPRAWLLRAWL